MTPERLASMLTCAVAFDLETHKLQPGLVAPPIVCGSWSSRLPDGTFDRALLRTPGAVGDEAREHVRRAFLWLLDNPHAVIVGANIAFDMLVMAVDFARRGIDLFPKIFAVYLEGRVFDVQIAEALHAVGGGHLLKDPRTGRGIVDPETGEGGKIGYRLSVVVDLVLGRVNAKTNDYWRERYALLENLPLEQWPAEAKVYPVDDATNTLEAALAQAGHLPNTGAHDWRGSTCARCRAALSHTAPIECTTISPRMNLHDHSFQVMKAFCLHLAGAWGMRTDPEATEQLIAAAAAGRAAGLPDFIELGWVRKDGSENQGAVKRAVAIAYGCTGACPACSQFYNRYGEPGKVPSPTQLANGKTDPCRACRRGKLADKATCQVCAGAGGYASAVNCTDCDGTGLNLDTANVPRTEPTPSHPRGQVQIGRDPLLESGDDRLLDYGYWGLDDKVNDTYGPFLRGGYQVPITLGANPILKTGRVSYRGVIQLLPRGVSSRLLRALAKLGTVRGVRDCFRARGNGWEVVHVPDDYVLQPGEEVIA